MMKYEREREKGRERARSLGSVLVCQYHKISDTCHCIEVFERVKSCQFEFCSKEGLWKCNTTRTMMWRVFPRDSLAMSCHRQMAPRTPHPGWQGYMWLKWLKMWLKYCPWCSVCIISNLRNWDATHVGLQCDNTLALFVCVITTHLQYDTSHAYTIQTTAMGAHRYVGTWGHYTDIA